MDSAFNATSQDGSPTRISLEGERHKADSKNPNFHLSLDGVQFDHQEDE